MALGDYDGRRPEPPYPTLDAATMDVLERLRALVMTLTPDTSAAADEHLVGLRYGHKQACNQVFDLISGTLGDYETTGGLCP